MPTYRPDTARAFLPDEYAPLLIKGISEESAVIRSGVRVIPTTAEYLRIPTVNTDPVAAWVAEGADIPASDPDLDEVAVRPSKLAGLTIISRELADDSSPAAAEVIGQSLSRDMARRLDQAFYGNIAAPAPAGLGSLTGVQSIDGEDYTNLDALVEAQTAVEAAGGAVGAWALAPTTWQQLATLKQSTGSNMPLLTADPTAASGRSIYGVPVFVSPAVPENIIYGYDLTRTILVMREDTRIETDKSRYFDSDRVAIRGIMRVGFAYPDPASITRITYTPAP